VRSEFGKSPGCRDDFLDAGLFEVDDPERVDSKKTVRLEYQIYRRLPRSWCRSDPGGGWIGLVTLGPILEDFDHSNCLYAECHYSRTAEETPDILRLRRPDVPIIKSTRAFRTL